MIHRAWTTVLAVLVLVPGCPRPGSVPERTAPRSKRALGVPYPIGDPVENPPVRALLARSQWLPVGGVAQPIVDEALRKAGPAVLGPWIVATESAKSYRALYDEAFGSKTPPSGKTVPIDPTVLARQDILPPAQSLWLVGPRGPCRATVAEPRIGYEASAGAVLEVSWTLQGCRGDGWAPVAIRAEQLPADLRWTPVQILTDLELEATGGWDHPLEHLLRAPDWEGPAATGHRVLAHEVPGLVPTPIEILYSHTRVEAPADETVSPDPCQVSSSTREIHGLWTGAGVETFEVAPDATATPMLRGAISQGDRPEALLYREGLGGWILVPPSVAAEANDAEPDGTDPGPAQWTEIPINVGVFTAQSWAAADYRVTVPGC